MPQASVSERQGPLCPYLQCRARYLGLVISCSFYPLTWSVSHWKYSSQSVVAMMRYRAFLLPSSTDVLNKLCIHVCLRFPCVLWFHYLEFSPNTGKSGWNCPSGSWAVRKGVNFMWAAGHPWTQVLKDTCHYPPSASFSGSPLLTWVLQMMERMLFAHKYQN